MNILEPPENPVKRFFQRTQKNFKLLGQGAPNPDLARLRMKRHPTPAAMPVELVQTHRHHASAKRRCVEWARLVRREAARARSLCAHKPLALANLAQLLAFEPKAPFDALEWNREALLLGVGLVSGESPGNPESCLRRIAAIAGPLSRGRREALEAFWANDVIEGEDFEFNATASALQALALAAPAKTFAMALHALGEALGCSGLAQPSIARLLNRCDSEPKDVGPIPDGATMNERLARAWFCNRDFLDGLLVFRGELAGQGHQAQRRVKRLPSTGLFESLCAIAKSSFGHPELAAWAAGQVIERAKSLGLELSCFARLDGDLVEFSLAQVIARGMSSRWGGSAQEPGALAFAQMLRGAGLDFSASEIEHQQSSKSASPLFVDAMAALRERDELAGASLAPSAPAARVRL